MPTEPTPIAFVTHPTRRLACSSDSVNLRNEDGDGGAEDEEERLLHGEGDSRVVGEVAAYLLGSGICNCGKDPAKEALLGPIGPTR